MAVSAKKIILMIIDALILSGAVFGALILHYDGLPQSIGNLHYSGLVAAYVAVSLGLFYLMGIYSSLNRYVSIYELVVMALASILSVFSFAVIQLLAGDQVSLSNLAIQLMMVMLGLGGSRVMLRMIRGRLSRQTVKANRNKVLIIGAGDAGVVTLKELEKNNTPVVGFLDDDPAKQGMRIHGVRVYGRTNQFKEFVRKFGVDQVVIAMPSASVRMTKEIVERAGGLGVRIQTLPKIHELINGQVTVKDIRDVAIEDLLEREPIKLDMSNISGYLKGKTVLITGAGGSIGSELCRQVSRFEPAKVVMLGHGENSIFEAGLDVRERFPKMQYELVIADVRDRERIFRVFETYRPDVVFHAAAHKHVPFMEDSPEEAVKTNVFGTQNVAEAAVEYGTKRFVMISTDKAVNPTSVMGATKRIAEYICKDLNRQGKTEFVSVRFGNVLGSRGSVVPVFKRQIARGGPVTVTDPEMKRYFMTIPEAVQLVLQAGSMGQGGEVFVLDMGEPVKIVDLAKNLIRLSGYEPGVDVAIEFTGVRPGEKLFEELLTAEEGSSATTHNMIFAAKDPGLSGEALAERLQMLRSSLKSSEAWVIMQRISEVVEFYRPGQVV